MFGRRQSIRRIPVLPLKGVIKPSVGRKLPGSGPVISIDQMREPIINAFNTQSAVAVALDINSPGGSPAQSELIAGFIRELADKTQLPVYAFVQDMAASGGYWIACAADKIFAQKTSILGSIGVISSGLNFSKLAETLGIESVQQTAGEVKSRLDPLKPIKDEDLKWRKALLEKMHTLFKNWVLERRGEALSSTTDLDTKVFNGDVWLGDEAVAIGLADGIGSFETVLTEEFGNGITIEHPEERRGLFSLMRSFGAADSALTVQGNIGEQIAAAAVEIIENRMAFDPYTFK